MAKAKFDIKNEAQRGLHAYVGAADLADALLGVVDEAPGIVDTGIGFLNLLGMRGEPTAARKALA